MGKLSEAQRKYIGANVSSIESRTNRNFQIVTPNTKTGEKVKGILLGAYPGSQAMAADSTFSAAFLLGNLWGDWTRFIVRAASAEQKKEMYNEIAECMKEHLDQGGSPGDSDNDPTEDPFEPSTDDPDKGGGKNTDWTTYVIIGAAAIVILLLVWDKFKKK